MLHIFLLAEGAVAHFWLCVGAILWRPDGPLPSIFVKHLQPLGRRAEHSQTGACFRVGGRASGPGLATDRSAGLQPQTVFIQKKIPQADGRDAVLIPADLDVVADYDDLSEKVRNAQKTSLLLMDFRLGRKRKR